MTCLRCAAADPPTAEALYDQAVALAEEGKNREAIETLNEAAKADKDFAPTFYLRGREHFRIGKFAESVADFDEYVRLSPEVESRQWERGISLYYAGEYERGAKQFEMYQTFQGNDVENAVWRYLCLAKTQGVDKARETLLPIENDRRVPMMQVYALYRGKLKPDDVLQAIQEANSSGDALEAQRFYAHLYLGLYYDAAGDQQQTRKYILLAADKKLAKNRRLNSYMWDVARIHAERLKEDQGVPSGDAKKNGR